MTPEARREAATGAYHQIADGPGPHTVERLIDALDEFYAAEIRAAVEAERDRCAKVAEEYEHAGPLERETADRIAAAIRERGKA